MFTYILKAFYQNFTNFLLGKEELHVPGDQGLNSVELINAMILSGLEEKEIKFPLDEKKYENKYLKNQDLLFQCF